MAQISIIVAVKIYWTNYITRTIGATQKIDGLSVGCVKAKILFLYIELLFMLEVVFILHSLDFSLG